ncbi:hypothetical protein PGQ11_009963 [Apiospora arundinis]|uniref:Uncharacterized protein n=1 Tax=Apiospora arundinis TaxID=335852 RepID=A0ABR2I880_9PEZI
MQGQDQKSSATQSKGKGKSDRGESYSMQRYLSDSPKKDPWNALCLLHGSDPSTKKATTGSKGAKNKN